MTNEVFSLLSEEEKQAKFKAVLKHKTNDALTDFELKLIMTIIPLGKQYEIRIYVDPDEFQNSLVLADLRHSRGIFGGVIAGVPSLSERTFNKEKVSAFVTERETDIVHIYIPKALFTKGCSNYEELKTKQSAL